MIAWRDAMSVGAPALDSDHKKLIDMINQAEQSVGQESWATVGTLINNLIIYAQGHFAREEVVMAKLKYPDLDNHRKAHEDIYKKLRVLREKFSSAATDSERQKCAGVLLKVIQTWLVEHVLREDMKYKPFIPVKAPPAPMASAPEGTILTGMPVHSEEEAAAERKARREAREKDVEYVLPENLQHLLKRMDYTVPQLPEPEKGFDSFEKFCCAAIFRRIDKVLVFFQRQNPNIQLELPPFFLASPTFAKKFHQAVEQFIFPVIWESRQIRVLSTSFDWANEDTDSFWKHVTRPLEQCLLQGWNNGWDELRLVETTNKAGQKVMQVKDSTKMLRALLSPEEESEYDIPRIGNREIDVLRSLLDPANDWSELLERSWRICNDLYEQEKDPRVFQQKAREGAFRDALLDAFNKFPAEWLDFVVLTCHRVFPRVTTAFMDNFTTNFGRNEADREKHIPYTIRYLRQVRERPEIQQRERTQEAEWKARMKELSDYLANRESNP